ncbi:uncharacterized protein LOC131224262 [Magnolia sinica]|uniref:uncharacterized protein LOC131224262 n=1 Tax=Magnolia sinica TaxID=86752 RepID=UPI00265AB0CD|nr:uncharacterized protein LOC131224262 [Magnolia sinica]
MDLKFHRFPKDLPEEGIHEEGERGEGATQAEGAGMAKVRKRDYDARALPSFYLHRFVCRFLTARSTSAAAESKAEKTAFNIKLEKFDTAARIKIIKEVRTFTDLGLKEAKDLVEKAPVVSKKGVAKEEAGPIFEKLKELGATVGPRLMVLPRRKVIRHCCGSSLQFSKEMGICDFYMGILR